MSIQQKSLDNSYNDYYLVRTEIETYFSENGAELSYELRLILHDFENKVVSLIEQIEESNISFINTKFNTITTGEALDILERSSAKVAEQSGYNFPMLTKLGFL